MNTKPGLTPLETIAAFSPVRERLREYSITTAEEFVSVLCTTQDVPGFMELLGTTRSEVLMLYSTAYDAIPGDRSQYTKPNTEFFATGHDAPR